MQIDFSAAFHRVSHFGLLFKLRNEGVCGAVYNVRVGFSSVKAHGVVIDGVTCVPQSSSLGPLLF